jgi:cystathionine beta-lyase/cystathionine gamma-synthase
MKNNTTRKSWNLSTRINHPERIQPGETNPPLLTPIYQSVKFVVNPDLPYHDQFIYSRLSNPNIKQLELTLADIQQKEDCLVYASGIAAISATMLSLLKSGDHVVTFRELYKPARMLIRDLLPNFGIVSSILKLSEVEKLEAAIIPGKTKLIHFESPTNPNLEIANIDEIIRIARKHNVIVSMDGTFAGLHQHTQFDIDLMINSLTKFANGHGDVLAGSVAGKKHLIQKIRYMSITLGATLDPHAAFLVERGLKTYLLRFERHAKNAMKVAQFLASHPKIEKVFYPGLETHPNHALAKKQMSDMGAVVSFVLKEAKAEEFCLKLGMIQMAVSLGATESIICPTHFFFGDDLNAEEKAQMGISHHSLRLSVGLEDADDIIADLKAAL